jgi:type IV secretion system protein VirB10
MSEPTFSPDAGTRLVVHSVGSTDPRLVLDERALVDASRNRFPVVAGTRAKRDGAGLAAGGAVALLLGGLTFWTMSSHRTQHPVAAPLPAAAPVPATVPAPFHAVPLSPPAPGLRLPSVPYVPAPGSEVRTGPAPVVVYDAGSMPGPAVTSAVPATVTPAMPQRFASNAAPTGENERFAAQVGEGQVPVATAQAMSNPGSTVTQGTLISAVLETAIDTDLPGYVRALVSQDVKSFDGSTVLIPRSSRLIGQYKSGLAAGQTRAYIIWSRLIRPDGASVALASPAVEYGGTSGLSGKVDGHFMKRFGSAVLLSVVGGLGAIGSGGTSVVLSSGGQSAAGVAASRDAQIPPTIRVAQGQPIRIFTARDLDFSSVGPVVASR